MAVAELWETLKHAIVAYTGLSPATFFTLLAVGGALYHTISGFLAPPPPPPRRSRELEAEREPLPPPVQVGEITEEELRAYDGTDPKKPLLMAIKGQIYDVTQSRSFYGPGGPYALFAGKDASRALAKLSFEPQDLNGDLSGLGPFELDALQNWELTFMSKYVKVGTVKKTVPVTEASDENAAAVETTETAERVIQTDNPVTEADHGERKEDGPADHSPEVEKDGLSENSKSEDNVVENGGAASSHDDGAEPEEKSLLSQSEDAGHKVEPKKSVDDEGAKE